jgi:antitoxin YefM
MAIQVTYSQARQELAALWDRIEEENEIAILTRQGHEDLALIEAAELSSLQETAHLVRSPANAIRLLDALRGSLAGEGIELTLEDLAAEIGPAATPLKARSKKPRG